MTNIENKVSKAFEHLDNFDSHIYGDLASLHDVLEHYRVDQEQVACYIEDGLPEKDQEYTLIEGGCRSGHLLSELETFENIKRVVGVDPFESMASLASERVEGTIINGSLEDTRVYSEADGYIASKEALSQADDHDIIEIAQSAHDSLNGHGVFIGQISNSNMFRNGEYTHEEYSVGRFEINIRSLESKVSKNRSIVLSQIEISNTNSNETKRRTIRTSKYYHNHETVEDALYTAGFARVSFSIKPDFASEEEPIVLAWT